ncbi:hypothetical protein ACHAXM_003630 [Skeletonema potamos]
MSSLSSSTQQQQQQQEDEKEREQQQQRPVTEYRILALYRFIPLVSPQRTTSNPTEIDDAKTNNNENGSKVDSTATSSSSWDEQTLMKHPERHPQLLQLQSDLYSTLRRYETRGTLLIAPEGINGTICYPYPPPPLMAADENDRGAGKYDNEDDPVKSFICNHPLFGGEGLRTRSSVWKENNEHDGHDNNNSNGNGNGNRPQQAFQRLKIKIKAEIVTLGLGRPITNPTTHIPTSLPHRHEYNQLANPNITKGTYLNPKQWDMAMKDPNVLVIDTRNSYEIEIGTFESAVDPQTKHFSEFPEYLERLAGEYDWSLQQQQQSSSQKDDEGYVEGSNNETSSSSSTPPPPSSATPKEQPKKKPPPTAIAMFCTGGIRCEKATSYALQSNLFPKNLPIYHLEGGILSYLDDVAKRQDDNEEAKQQQGGSSSSTFHGECFVFDKRVALTKGLEPSNKYISCHGCRGPMDRRLVEEIGGANYAGGGNSSAADIEKKREYEELLVGIRNLPPLTYDGNSQKWYVPGLTCPRCHDGTTRESFERFAQRKEQMEICAREGKSHFQDNGRK